jgi:hypothetical protein
MECDSVQGYFVSPPIPAADFDAFLENFHTHAAACPGTGVACAEVQVLQSRAA